MPPKEFICQVCGRTFIARKSNARFCSARCRLIAHRARMKQPRAQQLTIYNIQTLRRLETSSTLALEFLQQIEKRDPVCYKLALEAVEMVFNWHDLGGDKNLS